MRILDLYRKGHSPATARHMLQTDLMMMYPEDYEEKLADGRYNPTPNIFQHLFHAEFHNVYGSKSGALMVLDVEKMLTDYNKNCEGKTAIKLSAEKNAVETICICTPIMTRAHCLLKQSQELVLVDATGNMDKLNHRVYFFVTPTVAGGVPLGCIITANEREATFEAALDLLKSCFPTESCFLKDGPQVFMTWGFERKTTTSKTVPSIKITVVPVSFSESCLGMVV